MFLVFLCACLEPLIVSEGWLQYDTMVQIQIHPTKQQPISMQHKGPISLHFQQQQRDDSGGLLEAQPMRVKVGGGVEEAGQGRGMRTLQQLLLRCTSGL